MTQDDKSTPTTQESEEMIEMEELVRAEDRNQTRKDQSPPPKSDERS